jgi:hypothetical protein
MHFYLLFKLSGLRLIWPSLIKDCIFKMAMPWSFHPIRSKRFFLVCRKLLNIVFL